MNHKVLMPIIRNVMPNVIASQLVGVQPMTGSAGAIFAPYQPEFMAKMEKKHYQHFTKLYNRKRFQKVADLDRNGYGYISINPTKLVEARRWCRRNLKDGSYVECGIRIYFAYEKDITKISLVL